MNEPSTVTGEAVPELNPLYHFRWEEPQQAYVLLYPEGVVKVNETAAAIIKLCDGSHTADQIAAILSDEYEADVSGSVYKFLEVSHAKGWIRIKS